jgi:membrane protein DedA with SNARE-associated domain
MPVGKFVLYSTLGALPWSIALVYAGVQLGEHWAEIRDLLAPFDALILVAGIAAVVGYIWWHLGRPGWPRRAQAERAD